MGNKILWFNNVINGHYVNSAHTLLRGEDYYQIADTEGFTEGITDHISKELKLRRLEQLRGTDSDFKIGKTHISPHYVVGIIEDMMVGSDKIDTPKGRITYKNNDNVLQKYKDKTIELNVFYDPDSNSPVVFSPVNLDGRVYVIAPRVINGSDGDE